MNKPDKTKIKGKFITLYKYLYLRYDWSKDLFHCDIDMLINGTHIKISGYLDANNYTSGMHIVARSNRCTRNGNNCVELYLRKNDDKMLHKIIMDYVNEIGDLLDKDRKTYKLKSYVRKYVTSKQLMNKMEKV